MSLASKTIQFIFRVLIFNFLSFSISAKTNCWTRCCQKEFVLTNLVNKSRFIVMSKCFYPGASSARKHRRQSWGVGGVTPPDFGPGGRRGSQAGRGGRRRVVKHHYILSCTCVRKWSSFSLLRRNRIICIEFSCKWQSFVWINGHFGVND